MSFSEVDKVLDIHAEFRHEGINSALNPGTVLWHAWASLSHLEALRDEITKSTGKRCRSKTMAQIEAKRRHRTKRKLRSENEYRHRCPHSDCLVLATFTPTSVEGMVQHL